ncbi:MAG: hypothetical protein K6G87_02960 [Butyrivibrio sp.]|uniref:hypothetical protein n=1 Tax=Butyrivibrio sp. TaxID=28121 RepID=UPI0025CBC711|nr:hypothetical protein [Butyrivibrio sp.]MCR5770178.1 hypothetical protein [Butyrivibrio sp.]
MRNVYVSRRVYHLVMRIIMILTVTLLIFTIRNLFVASIGIHHIDNGIESCRDSINNYYANQGILLAGDIEK